MHQPRRAGIDNPDAVLFLPGQYGMRLSLHRPLAKRCKQLFRLPRFQIRRVSYALKELSRCFTIPGQAGIKAEHIQVPPGIRIILLHIKKALLHHRPGYAAFLEGLPGITFLPQARYDQGIHGYPFGLRRELDGNLGKLLATPLLRRASGAEDSSPWRHNIRDSRVQRPRPF